MDNVIEKLQKLGCSKAISDGTIPLSILRDTRWVKMFAEKGYTKGELIFPDGRTSNFFVLLPDGKIASADNIMLGNGFYAIAEELGIETEDIFEKPIGECIMYEDEIGIHEDCAISIWTHEEFSNMLHICETLKNRTSK